LSHLKRKKERKKDSSSAAPTTFLVRFLLVFRLNEHHTKENDNNKERGPRDDSLSTSRRENPSNIAIFPSSSWLLSMSAGKFTITSREEGALIL
jgi:hypothetical protein